MDDFYALEGVEVEDPRKRFEKLEGNSDCSTHHIPICIAIGSSYLFAVGTESNSFITPSSIMMLKMF